MGTQIRRNAQSPKRAERPCTSPLVSIPRHRKVPNALFSRVSPGTPALLRLLVFRWPRDSISYGPQEGRHRRLRCRRTVWSGIPCADRPPFCWHQVPVSHPDVLHIVVFLAPTLLRPYVGHSLAFVAVPWLAGFT